MKLLPSLKNKPSLISNSSDLLVRSSELARDNWLPLLILAVLPGILTNSGQILMPKPTSTTSLPVSIYGLGALGFLLLLINLGPLIVLSLSAIRQKAITVSECYSQGLKYSLPIFGLALLFIVAFSIGLVLLIIPGIVVLVLALRRYYLAPYFIVDKNLSISQAMAASKLATAPYGRYIVGILLVSFLLSLLSIILSGIYGPVGILVSLGASFFSTFMSALLYKQIQDAGPQA